MSDFETQKEALGRLAVQVYEGKITGAGMVYDGNITASRVKVMRPTMNLRFNKKNGQLEQQWVCDLQRDTEWRPVPTVDPDA